MTHTLESSSSVAGAAIVRGSEEGMDRLTKDAVNMLSVMNETANSKDHTKQYIYWIAVAVYHLLIKAIKIK